MQPFFPPAHKTENEGEVRPPHTRFRIRQAKKAASDLDVDSTANTQRTAAVMFSYAGAWCSLMRSLWAFQSFKSPVYHPKTLPHYNQLQRGR